MTYTEALAYIDALKPGGMKPGLARMERGLSLLGRPQDKLRVIHIAGTNGKGSTARMIQAMATANGLKTGLFTSPAVTGVRDTIQIDAQSHFGGGFRRPDRRTCGSGSRHGGGGGTVRIRAAHHHGDHLVCPGKDGSVRDRMRPRRAGGRDGCIRPSCGRGADPGQPRPHGCFGHSVEEIARAKCGILRPGCGVVCSPGQPAEALGVLLEEAAGMGLTVHVPGAAAAPIRECTPGRLILNGKGRRCPYP